MLANSVAIILTALAVASAQDVGGYEYSNPSCTDPAERTVGDECGSSFYCTSLYGVESVNIKDTCGGVELFNGASCDDIGDGSYSSSRSIGKGCNNVQGWGYIVFYGTGE